MEKYEIIEFCKTLGFGLGIVGIFAIPVFAGIFYVSSLSCSARATALEVGSRWGVLTGCIVKFEGRWIPVENIGVRYIKQGS